MFFQNFSRFLRAITVGGLLLAITHPLAAAQLSQAQLDELMRVTRMQDMISPAMAGVEQEIRQTMGQLAQQIGMDEARKQRFDQAVVQRLIPQIRNEMSWQKLAPLFQEAMMQAIDADDVEPMLAFYRSPAGRAYQAATMELFKDPNFINAEQTESMLMLQAKLSAADFQALVEFNDKPGVQRVQNRMEQIMPMIVERSVAPQIEKIVKSFMEQEFFNIQ